jgi:hypothetical protein
MGKRYNVPQFYIDSLHDRVAQDWPPVEVLRRQELYTRTEIFKLWSEWCEGTPAQNTLEVVRRKLVSFMIRTKHLTSPIWLREHTTPDFQGSYWKSWSELNSMLTTLLERQYGENYELDQKIETVMHGLIEWKRKLPQMHNHRLIEVASYIQHLVKQFLIKGLFLNDEDAFNQALLALHAVIEKWESDFDSALPIAKQEKGYSDFLFQHEQLKGLESRLYNDLSEHNKGTLRVGSNPFLEQLMIEIIEELLKTPNTLRQNITELSAYGSLHLVIYGSLWEGGNIGFNLHRSKHLYSPERYGGLLSNNYLRLMEPIADNSEG